MEILQENIDSLNAFIKVQMKKEDYEPQVEKNLKAYSKQVEIKGFRKGQVPKSIVKKMYGNQLLSETINDLLSKEVNNYIVENKLDVLGHPIPKDGQQFDVVVNDMKDFDFSYEIGLAPDFKLTYLDKNPTVEREVPKVTKEMLDEEVERMQKRYGKVEEVTGKLQDDDMLAIKLDAQDESGHHNHTSIALDMIKDKKAAAAVKKMKIGDTIDIDPFTAFDKPEAEVAKQIVGQEGLLAEHAPKYTMTLESAKRVMPAEINAEFLDGIYGKGEVKDEAGLRTKLEEDIDGYFSKQGDAKLYNKVAENLIEKTDMPLPDAFLKKWIAMTNENPITPEQIEKDYEGFQKNLKWSLIIKKVGKENNIEVADSEVRAKIGEQVKQQMLSYGIPTISDEETAKFVDNMMAQKEHVNKTKETILEEKMFEYFKTQLTIKDKKVSLEEFNK